jgi:hypothetical protein
MDVQEAPLPQRKRTLKLATATVLDMILTKNGARGDAGTCKVCLVPLLQKASAERRRTPSDAFEPGICSAFTESPEYLTYFCIAGFGYITASPTVLCCAGMDNSPPTTDSMVSLLREGTIPYVPTDRARVQV